MAKCLQCNITISDDTMICPLCDCVVEGAYETERMTEYPQVRSKQRKMQLVSNLILSAVLISGVILIGLNLAFHGNELWCLIPVAAMVYAYLSFKMIFVSRKGYRAKVFVPIILALGLLLIIDIGTGFYRWSLNYVLPSAILVTDIIILILMLTNFRNRYSYMIMQIAVMAVCIIPMALWIVDIISAPVLALIAAGVSVSMFMGTLIIGGRTAKQELKIRFHIR